MADPKYPLNPSTIHFVDTSPTVSQAVPVTAANPLPVTLTTGTTDQDVNLVGINGVAPSVGSGALGTGTQRVALATNSPGVFAAGQAAMAASEPVVIASDQSSVPVTVAASGASAAVSLTRPNDTNVYAANDVIGSATGSTAALTFASMGPSGADVMITSVSLEIDLAAVISGMTSFLLYLYNVTPPSALGDNAAWDLPSGDRASFLGFVNLGTPLDLGSTLYVQVDGINKQVKLAGTSLFGYLVTVGTWTPSASIVNVITLHTVTV